MKFPLDIHSKRFTACVIQFKWGRRSREFQLDLSSNNRFAILARITDNISMYDLDKGDFLREVTVKIGLERIDMQEGIMVEALLNSRVT